MVVEQGGTKGARKACECDSAHCGEPAGRQLPQAGWRHWSGAVGSGMYSAQVADIGLSRSTLTGSFREGCAGLG